jgi:hypothetical protein
MNEHRSTAFGVQVRKRDGQAEPFCKHKVAATLRGVLLATGEGTVQTAAELAEAVSCFVISSRSHGPMRTHQITALLKRVLDETGHADAAALLKARCAARDRVRRHVQVLAWKDSIGRVTPRRWNKSVLASRLQREYDLEAATARMFAGRVEAAVFGLSLRRVTSRLVRELAECELMAWGLLQAPCDARDDVVRRRT